MEIEELAKGSTGRYIPEIMRWSYAISNSEKNQTYTTPALCTLFFFREQLKKFNQLGYTKNSTRSQRKGPTTLSMGRSTSTA